MRDVRERRDFTKEELENYLSYNQFDGIFRWKIKTRCMGRAINCGDVAGTNKDGYCAIFVFGRQYRAHHLAYLCMKNEWPTKDLDIDHINRNRFDNSWANLRLATRSQNNMNILLRSNNKSGHKGVSYIKSRNKWHARITVNKKIICLGDFVDKNDAIIARQDAEKIHFGQYSSNL